MKRIIALLMVLSLCIVFAACGEKKSENDPASPDSTSSTVDEGTAKSTAASENTVYGSVQEYIETEEVVKEMQKVKEAVEETFVFEYYADGDMLVYDYTYTTHFEQDDVNTLKESLDESLESNATNYSSAVDVLKKHVNTDSPKIEIIYRNDDGSIITSRIYE